MRPVFYAVNSAFLKEYSTLEYFNKNQFQYGIFFCLSGIDLTKTISYSVSVMEKRKKLTASYERIKIRFSLFREGDDYFILVTGGRSHLGAAGFFCKGVKPYSINFPEHRDKDVVDIIIEKLSPHVNGNLIVAAGIHYDDITPEEINRILEMCGQLADKAGALV